MKMTKGKKSDMKLDANVFYAKPDQSYREHVEAVYEAWVETVAAKQRLIEHMAILHGFSVERFLKGSLLTVVLHDLGKMVQPFQDMMKAIRQGRTYNRKNNYRHELVSFNFAVFAAIDLGKEEKLIHIPVEALAVAGHHRPLNTDLTSFERERMAAKPVIDCDGIKEALDLAVEIFARHGWVLPVLSEGLERDNPYNRLVKLVNPQNNVISQLVERDGYQKVRDVYLLTKGILHYADWHASGKARVNYRVQTSSNQLVEVLRARCQEKGINFKGLRPFQSKMGKHSGHLLAIAPTGSGKTEGSLLWALKNAEEMGGAKVIYLLPTMNTANQIWQRMADIFGEENVGLTHSTANLFFRREIDDDKDDCWDNRRNLLFDQSFILPITVGTIDQLLTSGFNAGRWVLKEINAANAVIVLDEIHSYDGWTLGLIIAGIRRFTALGARFLMMSATFPQGLVDLFKQVIKNLNIIREESLIAISRSTYKVIDQFINDEKSVEMIFQAVSEGYKVLVVVNTVEQCQELAQRFAELKPICYHSRFILRDRKNIEQKIDYSHFVIATQVVEVSLDIDYDWLFTECAPPDAIIQRAGRVNRYRNPARDSRVYIFMPSNKSGKIYNPINNPELLQRSLAAFRKHEGRLTEQCLIDIVDQVYSGYRIDHTEAYREAIGLYKYLQKRRMAFFDSRLGEDEQEITRRSKYDTVSAIPTCFFEEVISLPPKERRWYEVKVPLWYFREHKKIQGGLSFCDLKYDSLIGALLQPDDDRSWFI